MPKKQRLSKPANAIDRKNNAAGLAGVRPSLEAASFQPLVPEPPRPGPPPSRHGFHPLPRALSLTLALAFAYAKPCTEGGGGRGQGSLHWETTQCGVCSRVVHSADFDLLTLLLWAVLWLGKLSLPYIRMWNKGQVGSGGQEGVPCA